MNKELKLIIEQLRYQYLFKDIKLCSKITDLHKEFKGKNRILCVQVLCSNCYFTHGKGKYVEGIIHVWNQL